MSGTHFYLTLPSNASLDVFPDNKTTEYRVKLPQPVELDGNWEVGLYSIFYPRTWYTLRNSSVDTHFYYVEGTGWPSVATMKYGHYETMQDFVKSMNATLELEIGNSTTIYLTYSTLTGKVTVHLKPKCKLLLFGKMSHRAYLETLLNYGPSAKDSQLTAALYYKDTAGKMDIADPTTAGAAGNAGLRARYVFSKTSGTVEMTGPIFSDIFMSERLLLSYVDLKVILNRSSDEFCLMASEDDVDYRVKLTDAYLKIRKVKVNPSISVAHEIALKKGPAIYPIRRVECKSFIVPAGNPSLRKDNLFNGMVPKTVVFGLVESEAFNGALKKNPYNFQHFNVSSIGITVNGEEMPFKPLQLSYGAAPKYIEAFSTLFSGTGKMYYNTGNDISREEFPKGYAVYAFDLTPDMCGASPHFNVVQKGNLAIDIQFSVAPAAAVSLVCYGEFENTVHIDSERNVIYDYSG